MAAVNQGNRVLIAAADDDSVEVTPAVAAALAAANYLYISPVRGRGSNSEALVAGAVTAEKAARDSLKAREGLDLELETKYYKATVGVTVGSLPSPAAVESLDDVIESPFQGVVLVTRGEEEGKEMSDAKRASLKGVLTAIRDTLSPEVLSLMYVAGSSSRGGGDEEADGEGGGAESSEYSEDKVMKEWSVGHGIETTSFTLDEAKRDGVDGTTLLAAVRSREKRGIARVLEALQTVMWPAMEFRTPLRPGGGTDGETVVVEATAAETDAGSSSSSSSPVVVSPGANGTETETSTDAAAGVVAVAAASAAVSASASASASDATPSSSSSSSPSSSSSSAKEDREREAESAFATEFAQMEGLFKEARRIREMNMEGGLPDEQRREAAAKMALRLAAMLEGLGGADGEEEEGGGGEGGGEGGADGKKEGAAESAEESGTPS